MLLDRQKYAFLEDKIIAEIAVFSNTNKEDWFLVSRARHALELAFKALPQTEVANSIITQPFTCVTAVNPILTAGFEPVYCDINKINLSLDTANLGKLIDTRIAAIVAQHTLGLRCDIESISNMKKMNNFVLVEDSAHCLGRVSPLADVSIHSFGAEKILNTSFGAAIWVNPQIRDTDYGKKLINLLENLPVMSLFENLTYNVYPLLNKIINRLPEFSRNSIRKIISKLKIFIVPVMPVELHGKNFRTPKVLSKSLLKRIFREISKLNENVGNRNIIASTYKEVFKTPKTEDNPNCVRYPLLCQNKNEAEIIFTKLRKKGYPIGKWYRPLIFPGINGKVYNYRIGSCPVAEECSELIINLPTNIKHKIAKEIINEIKSIRTY